MKLKHIIVAGVASFAFASLGLAQQQPEQQSPGASGQEGAQQPGAMEQERGAMPGGRTTDQERAGQQAQGSGGQQMTQDSQVIRQAQKKLKEEGYQVGPVDGIWGPKTQSAVREFQQAEGLEASGQLDQQTLAALEVQPGGEAGESGAGTATGAAEQDQQGQKQQQSPLEEPQQGQPQSPQQ